MLTQFGSGRYKGVDTEAGEIVGVTSEVASDSVRGSNLKLSSSHIKKSEKKWP